jgi:hypothetical protein
MDELDILGLPSISLQRHSLSVTGCDTFGRPSSLDALCPVSFISLRISPARISDRSRMSVASLTPVCDSCVSPKEQDAAKKQAPCLGCGQRMMLPGHGKAICSNRCAQRARRAARRASVRAHCANCGVMFTPSRSDARHCSNACRQAAYRAKDKP